MASIKIHLFGRYPTMFTPTEVLEIDIHELMPDPSQPRKTFPDEEITRLAASIAARGVMQPLRVVRDPARQCWVILTGESRFRGAKQAGLKSVPCLPVTGELSEIDKLVDRLTENSVRHDLQPMEEARGLSRLKALKNCNSRTLIEEYGFSGASITRAEALTSLPDHIQAMVGNGPGRVPPSAAYEISRLEDPIAQAELAHAVVNNHLSRDRVAERVRGTIGKRDIKPKAARLVCRLEGGVSVTVTADQPLDWETLIGSLDRVRREAKKLHDGDKEVTALPGVLRAC